MHALRRFWLSRPLAAVLAASLLAMACLPAVAVPVEEETAATEAEAPSLGALPVATLLVTASTPAGTVSQPHRLLAAALPVVQGPALALPVHVGPAAPATERPTQGASPRAVQPRAP